MTHVTQAAPVEDSGENYALTYTTDVRPRAASHRQKARAAFNRVILSHRETLLRFVEWLANPALGLDALDEGESALYRRFAQENRLIGRVVERLLAADDRRRFEPLYAELARDHCHQMYMQRQLFAHATETFAAVCDIADEFIILKGASAFHATRNPFTIRQVGDIDVLIPDPRRSLALLGRPGLTEEKVPVQHEQVNIIRDGRHYDFHKHFPVWQRKGTAPAVTGNVVVHHENVEIAPIAYADIRRGAIPLHQGMSVKTFYPAPEVAAFIQLVHFYRDFTRLFIGWLYYRSRVFFQEIADIRDLLVQSGFDRQLFAGLIAKYEAEEQALVCASYIDAILRDRTLLELLGKESLFKDLRSPGRFTADIWYGFAFEFEASPAQLLLMPISAASEVARLASGTVPYAAPRQEAHISLGDENWQVHVNGAVTDFTLDIVIDGSVTIEASLRSPTAISGSLSAFVSVGLQCFHFDFDSEDPRKRYSATPGSTVHGWARDREGDRHTARVVVNLLDDSADDGRHLDMVIGIGAVRENGFLEFGALVMPRFERHPTAPAR